MKIVVLKYSLKLNFIVKMKIIRQLVFLSCLIICVNFSMCGVMDNLAGIFGVMREGYTFFEDAINTGKTIKANYDVSKIFGSSLTGSTGGKLNDLDEDIERLSDIVHEMQNRIENKLRETKALAENLGFLLEMYHFEHSINKKAGRVVTMYRSYQRYSNNITNFDNFTLSNFANVILGIEKDSVMVLLDSIHRDVVGRRMKTESLLSLLVSHLLTEYDSLCNTGRPIQFSIFEFYAVIIMLEHMGTSMMLFALQYNAEGYGNKYSKELLSKIMIDKNKRVNSYTDQFLSVLKDLPRDIRRCDPITKIRDVTFYEFDGFLQGVLIRPKWDSMWFPYSATCFNFYLDRCESPEYCNYLTWGLVRPCTGKIDNCKSIGQIFSIELCYAPIKKMDSTTRRYRWFEVNADHEKYGEHNEFGKCDYTNIYERGESFSLTDINMGDNTHRSCGCICQENSRNGNRYGFSTSYALSDYKENMVIVGVRLRKRKNIIYIQIKQGKLLAYGDIRPPENDEWLPLPFESVSEQNAFHLDEEHNQIDLNNAIAEPGHVLVGVKFVNINEGKRLRLVAVGVPFDVKTGVLNHLLIGPEAGYGNLHTNEILLEDVDSPLATDAKIVQISGNNSFIRIQHTSWTKDIAQTTIPFFDAQELYAEPYLALNGIGLAYRSAGDDFAGFVTLKLYALDLAPIMEIVTNTTSEILRKS